MATANPLDKQQTYFPSGRIGNGWWMIPLGGIPIVFVISLIYAYINVYLMVWGYISLLLFGLYLIGLFFSASILAYLAKCRSPALSSLIGFLLGGWAFYSWWAVFVYALLGSRVDDFNATMLDVVLSPVGIWEVAKAIGKEGWFTIAGITPKGWVLWGAWGVEAICVLATTTCGAAATPLTRVFCETCDIWCDVEKRKFGFGEKPHLLTELSADNLAPLAELVPHVDEHSDHVRLDTWHCPHCRETAVLQINRVTVSLDKDGKPQENDDAVTPMLVVRPDLLDAIKQISSL